MRIRLLTLLPALVIFLALKGSMTALPGRKTSHNPVG